jgi:hypothetical protein
MGKVSTIEQYRVQTLPGEPVTYRFPDTATVLNVAMERYDVPPITAGVEYSLSGKDDFYGETLADFVAEMRGVPSDKVKAIRERAAALATTLEKGTGKVSPRPQMARHGRRANVATYLAGSPRHMVKYGATETVQPVSIAVNPTVQCTVKAEVMETAGANVMAAILAASKVQPVTVSLVPVQSRADRSRDYRYEILQPSDGSGLAMILRREILRRLGIALEELSVVNLQSGYGQCSSKPHDICLTEVLGSTPEQTYTYVLNKIRAAREASK